MTKIIQILKVTAFSIPLVFHTVSSASENGIIIEKEETQKKPPTFSFKLINLIHEDKTESLLFKSSYIDTVEKNVGEPSAHFRLLQQSHSQRLSEEEKRLKEAQKTMEELEIELFGSAIEDQDAWIEYLYYGSIIINDGILPPEFLALLKPDLQGALENLSKKKETWKNYRHYLSVQSNCEELKRSVETLTVNTKHLSELYEFTNTLPTYLNHFLILINANPNAVYFSNVHYREDRKISFPRVSIGGHSNLPFYKILELVFSDSHGFNFTPYRILVQIMQQDQFYGPSIEASIFAPLCTLDTKTVFGYKYFEDYKMSLLFPNQKEKNNLKEKEEAYDTLGFFHGGSIINQLYRGVLLKKINALTSSFCEAIQVFQTERINNNNFFVATEVKHLKNEKSEEKRKN